MTGSPSVLLLSCCSSRDAMLAEDLKAAKSISDSNYLCMLTRIVCLEEI